jgi:hypothetical protein
MTRYARASRRTDLELIFDLDQSSAGQSEAAFFVTGAKGYNIMGFRIQTCFLVALAFCCMLEMASADAGQLPEIVSGPSNLVPVCVTPNRLMEFARDRDRALNPPQEIDGRFSDLASIY